MADKTAESGIDKDLSRNLEEAITRYPSSRDYLIPILQAVQDVAGYLPREGIYRISDHLGLPESKIYGVATFYNQFRLVAPGKHRILVCRGTACHVKGSMNLLDLLTSELGIQPDETTQDGLFSLEVVACLGACSIAPVITIDGEFFGRLDKKKLLSLLQELGEKESIHA